MRRRRTESGGARDADHLLPTEAPHARADQLDRLSTKAVVRLLLDEEVKAARTATRAASSIAAAAERVATTLREGGRLIYVGAGTSGRLGALDAAELGPTFRVGADQVLAIVAGGGKALGRAVEGAEDRPAELRRAFARHAIGPRDLVCAIAASGTTPFTRAALDEARRRGAATVFLTCAPPAPGARADLVIHLAVGPEVIAGSTRLKSATATKVALNAISTAAMVRLGKVWRGRMVDLVATNVKLRARARRILVELGGVAESRARALLRRSGGEVKPALVAALLEVDVPEARRRLATAGGELARVVGMDRGAVSPGDRSGGRVKKRSVGSGAPTRRSPKDRRPVGR